MENIKILEAQIGHVDYVIKRLRKTDKEFATRFVGLEPQKAVTTLFMTSKKAWVATLDNVPYALFGVSQHSTLGYSGYTWMCATSDINKNKLKTARLSKEFIVKMKGKYDKLIGVVDGKDKTSQKWHTFMGYKLSEPKHHDGYKYYIATLGEC